MGARARRRRPRGGGRTRRTGRFPARLLIGAGALGAAALVIFLALRGGAPDPGRAGRADAPPPTAAATPDGKHPARPAARTPAPRGTAARTPAAERRDTAHGVTAAPAARPSPRSAAPTAAGAPTPPAATATAAVRTPQAAILIDDLGRSIRHLREVADLGTPVSIAVLPGIEATERTAREAAERGIEVLVHLPMEPRPEAGKDPGPGALLTSMAPEAILATLRADLAAVPGAVGVNNHMGSRFTADPAALAVLMGELRARGLFWVDSRTSADTRAFEVAEASGVPAAARDVFLDATVEREFVRGQVRRLVALARERGSAIGIGHPHPETLGVLREMRDELAAAGVAWVPVSALVGGRPAKLAAAGAPGPAGRRP